MSTTTISLIVLAVVVIAAIAFFALRSPRGDTVAVAASDAGDDPALSATGEAMIVGDVMLVGDAMPIDSNEMVIPPGTAQPPRTVGSQAAPPRASQATPPRESQTTPPRASQSSPREPQSADEDVAPLCQSELVEDCATQRAEIRWTKRFDPREGALDDSTRLNLIRDLGIVRAPWGVPLLTQAYEEEPAAEHRRAALRALAAYRHPDTQPTFESALRADDEETRAIAATALGALRIRAALPS